MKTTMYLLRHAAAEANYACAQSGDALPILGARLPGGEQDPRLSRLGVRQAEATREFLAVRPIDYCYCSPRLRAVQTASIIGAPHGLFPVVLDSLVEPERATAALEELFRRHAGHALLVVGHQDVNLGYLAGLLGMDPEQARQVQLDNCGISLVVRTGTDTTVSTLNASFHLQGIAA
ncbi:MAG TPA: histidine phosphatase family protein [Gemmataceae bacterium]|jgi:broad specificity phosphatase PhoE|nr:histidine phosphatase family protein [Gemmataceae bacterium]